MEKTAGVVLIDEVDLHLHPHWQRTILNSLKTAFPRVQFIVTTHSPQVVASAGREELRLLGRSQELIEAPFVEGRDTNSLLQDVFFEDERPAWMTKQLEELAQLIEEDKTSEAREMLEIVTAKMGPDDSATLRAGWELDLNQAGSDNARVSQRSPA